MPWGAAQPAVPRPGHRRSAAAQPSGRGPLTRPPIRPLFNPPNAPNAVSTSIRPLGPPIQAAGRPADAPFLRNTTTHPAPSTRPDYLFPSPTNRPLNKVHAMARLFATHLPPALRARLAACSGRARPPRLSTPTDPPTRLPTRPAARRSPPTTMRLLVALLVALAIGTGEGSAGCAERKAFL